VHRKKENEGIKKTKKYNYNNKAVEARDRENEFGAIKTIHNA